MPPYYPQPSPAGPDPTPVPDVLPVPEESVDPEDDEYMLGSLSPMTRPALPADAAPVNAAPETADGLEELQAQLRQLRWAHPGATA